MKTPIKLESKIDFNGNNYTPYKFDDGDGIWLNWDDFSGPEEIDNLVLSSFNVFNIPSWIHYEFEHYFNPTYVDCDNRSTTKQFGMFINRNKKVYKRNNI